MFEPIEYDEAVKTKIKIIGVGGGGCNAVDHMIETAELNTSEYADVQTWAVNTDLQALKKSKAQNHLQIGANITRGLG